MISVISFPGKYIQGYEAIKNLGPELKKAGESGFLICSPTVLREILPGVRKEISKTVDLVAERFGGECSDQEIDRLVNLARKVKCDVVAGLGGGKTLDTAKMVAYRLGTRVIIVPTVASSDAPCTGLAVIYNTTGEMYRLMLLPQNPNIVLVDTKLLTQAPVRFFIAGMGEALSAYFEGESCQKKNPPGFRGSITLMELGHLTYTTLMKYGIKAKRDCDAHIITPAVERVVEAITLLSGLCHENVGVASAHAISGVLEISKEAHHCLHGETVGYGTLASLFLMNKPRVVIDQVYSFCEAVGLPTTLADIGLVNISDENIMKMTGQIGNKVGTTGDELPPISVKAFFDAIKAADVEGRKRKSIKT